MVSDFHKESKSTHFFFFFWGGGGGWNGRGSVMRG